MKIIPDSVSNLIEEFSKLPGIGTKTASRLTFYLLSKPDSEVQRFGQTLLDLKKSLKSCQNCFNITEESPCEICALRKLSKKIMIVEEPLDIMALEKTGYDGLYHVLGGVISPIEGIGPENLRVREILEKIKANSPPTGGIEEIILATNPSLEGEATAMYLARAIKKINPKIKVTRIARGLPIGGDLEYADEVTLRRAIEGRKDY